MATKLGSTILAYRSALIIGEDREINAATSQALVEAGLRVAIATQAGKAGTPSGHDGPVSRFAADVSDPASVRRLFEDAEAEIDGPDVVLFHVASPSQGALADLDPEAVRRSIEAATFGSFLVVQQAARRLLPLGYGAILLIASVGDGGGVPSTLSAIGKLGLRGVAQGAARELAPHGIYVASFVIEGDLDSSAGGGQGADPQEVARTFVSFLTNPRSDAGRLGLGGA